MEKLNTALVIKDLYIFTKKKKIALAWKDYSSI